MLPAAIAWACAPSTAQIAFDRSTYKAGETVAVIGSGFAPNNVVELNLQGPSGGPQAVDAGASTDSSGYFEASFALAAGAAPGDYALQAKTTPSGQGHGGQTQPSTASATFKVMGAPGAAVPPILRPEPTAPADPVSQPPRRNARAALRKAVRRCNRRHRAKRGTRASGKRKLAKRRKACVRKAKKRYS